MLAIALLFIAVSATYRLLCPPPASNFIKFMSIRVSYSEFWKQVFIYSTWVYCSHSPVHILEYHVQFYFNPSQLLLTLPCQEIELTITVMKSTNKKAIVIKVLINTSSKNM